MTKKTQVDLLFDKYQEFLKPITKEQEELALSYDEMDGDDFEIRIPISKKMLKRFIKYYNLTCLYEYLDDCVLLTEGKEQEECDKELSKVCVAMQRLKDNFYKEMYRNFLTHNVALYDFEDDGVGESDCDLMTRWANSIQSQIREYLEQKKEESNG